MIRYIIKDDGSQEPFSADKVNGWGEWAAKKLGKHVDWSSIVMGAVAACPEYCPSRVLQEQLIKQCVNKKSWSYYRMAGRLYMALYYKDLFGVKQVTKTIKEVQAGLVADGYMVPLAYSDEEYAELEKVINHSLDLEEPHYAIEQLRKKYSIKHKITGKEYETPQFVYMRMAMALGEDEPSYIRMERVKKWYKHFSEKRINSPTPNYTNLGTPHRGFASCAVFKASDDRRSLAIHDHGIYTMTYMSAGIGSLVNTRSMGDTIRDGAITHQGKLPYYRTIVANTHANVQGGRGGAATTYFSAYDPEVEVITKLKNPMSTEDKKIRGIDYAMQQGEFFTRKAARNEDIFLFNVFTAPDLYEAMFKGDQTEFETLYQKYDQDDSFAKTYVPARKVLLDQLRESGETGRSYLMWTDEMNRHTPHNDPIYSSNLCVSADTKILTDEGYVEIGKVAGTKQNIWNGQEWSEVDVVQTGENQRLITVKTSSTRDIKCTPYHKFYVKTGYGANDVVEKRAFQLEPGDKLIKFDLPLVEGHKELEQAYENGFFTADGTAPNIIYLYGKKKDLLPNFNGVQSYSVESASQDRMRLRVDGLKEKHFVPDASYSIESRLRWLEGFLDGDGCVVRNGTNESIQAVSIEFDFLYDLQEMLQTIGIQSKVVKAMDGGMREMPKNDGSGEKAEYMCNDTKRILISSTGVRLLKLLGFAPKRLELSDHTPNRCAEQFIKIEEVVDEGIVGDTFCFNEPKRHRGMFNGVLTGQCLETGLPTQEYTDMRDLYSEEDHGRGEIALCSLGGVLPANIKDDAEYEEVCEYTLRMIDKCIHMSHYELPHVGVTAKARLNAGIGLIGVAHYMAKNHASYGSDKGKRLLHELSEKHAYYCIKASLKLGKELGNAPWMHKTKWPEGWLPIDTYKDFVDTYVDPTLKYDWETLRAEIIDNGGIRNSSLINMMPSESSSKASSTTNGVYPIRDLVIVKSDKNNIIRWAAPEGEKLAKWYDNAWSLPTTEMIKCYGIIQKFTDQSISADVWEDLSDDRVLSSSELIANHILMTKVGMKTRYYFNSKTSSSKNALEIEEESCSNCTL